MTASRIEGTTNLVGGGGGGGGTGGIPDDGSVTTAKLAPGAVTSAKISDGTIVNADIAPGAAIATTKLSPNPLARTSHTGTQTAATISDFDAQVHLSRLDQMATPTAPVDLAGQILTDVAEPVGDTDAATKGYADTKVARTGDTMTGGLVISPAPGNTPLSVNGPDAGEPAIICAGIAEIDVVDLTGNLPTAPTPGQLWYDSADDGNTGAVKYQNENETITVGAGGGGGGSGIPPGTLGDNTVLKADVADTPVGLTVAPSTLVGRAATGAIAAVKVSGDMIANGAVSDINIVGPISSAKFDVNPLDRALHTGTQLAATISNFDTAVRLSRLDQLATPTSPVNMGAQPLSNLGPPALPTDAATKAYADGLTSGIPPSVLDANSIMKADSDDTPAALLVPPSSFVGRDASGPITTFTPAQAKTLLAFTTSDIGGLGALATKSTVTSADIADGTIQDVDLAGNIDVAKLAIDTRARATHTGTQLAATVSDLDATVRAYRLDQFQPPTAPVNMQGQSLTALPAPVAATDAVTKAYADTLAAGIDVKASVKTASTANVNIASPGTTMDAISLTNPCRVLLKNQTDATQNGIYVWTGSAIAMTRALDANEDAEVTSGMFTFVESGTANGAKGFLLTTIDPITLGTTALAFTQFSGGGSSMVGTTNRITVTGTQIDIASNYVGQSTITTVGSVTTGTWNATPVAIAKGGTGGGTAAAARANLNVPGIYTTNIGIGSPVTNTITHNLGTNNVIVELYETANGKTVYADVVRISVNAITVTFAESPTATVNVVVMGAA